MSLYIRYKQIFGKGGALPDAQFVRPNNVFLFAYFVSRVSPGATLHSLILIDSPASESLEQKIKTLVSLITPTPK